MLAASLPAYAQEALRPAEVIRRDGDARFATPAYAQETLKLSDLLGEARAKNPALSAMQYKYEAGGEQCAPGRGLAGPDADDWSPEPPHKLVFFQQG